jgi:hypothetical protein
VGPLCGLRLCGTASFPETGKAYSVHTRGIPFDHCLHDFGAGHACGVFDALALRGLGTLEAFQNQQPLRVWDAKMPGRPLFDMWFAEDAVDSMDW